MDYIYSSYDDRDRMVAGLKFKGRGGWVSFKQGRKKPWAAVALRGSSIKGLGLILESGPLQKRLVTRSSYITQGKKDIGTFKVQGVIDNPDQYRGVWQRVNFGNEVNNIYKISDIEVLNDKNESIVRIEGRPGLKKETGGWIYSGHPFKKGSKQAYLVLSHRAEYFSKEFLSSIGE